MWTEEDFSSLKAKKLDWMATKLVWLVTGLTQYEVK
jgi:hypothetical protein